ncbi:MAG: 30S ribosomal protein S17 [Candidatus Giovannonibacteria bacterium]|nr:MAG: 30S ribosomal protein S17 [Candidatus Giovannonibacteria bacterium]
MPQTVKGTVVSNKMRRTIVVEVSRIKKHRLYGKFIKISKRYKAHTTEDVPEGAKVVLEACRPISKNKKWKLVKVL